MTERPAGQASRAPIPAFLSHPRVGDVALLVAILVLAGGHDVADPSDGPLWLCLSADVGLALPLLFRRSHPLPTFLTVSAVALAQWAGDLRVSGDIAVLVALYAVGVYDRSRRNVAVAAAVAELGVVLAVARWAPPGHVLTGIILSTGTVTASWVLGRYVRTHRAYVASVLERAANAEHERDQQAQIATVSERARISREMHDIVAHSLSVMIALGDGAAISMDAEPETAREGMRQSSALGRQALGEMRRLLGTLHESDEVDLMPQPGMADLDELVAKVRSAGLAVELVVEGPPAPLAPAAQLTIYRMVQEALTNVLKHAPAATRAIVRIRYRDDGVELEVENDDPGPPARRAPSGGVTVNPGHGLAGMRERAAVFGGAVEAAPRVGGGWRVASHLRLQEDPDAMTIRILLVDDQPLLRQGFRMILSGQPDIEVVGEAGNGTEAVRMTRLLSPDVVLMDVRMPGEDGIAATRQIVAQTPATRVLILTTYNIDQYAFSGLNAGASGFLLKDVEPADLVAAIHTVARGDAVIAPSVTRRLLEVFAHRLPEAAPDAPRDDVLTALTDRERQVFTELAAGLTNAEIATRLRLSDATVKTHVGRILAKLGLRDRVQAVILAYETGVTRPAG